MFCCIKTILEGSKIARLCKDDECEHKKRLNFWTKYKISTAFCDFIPKCTNWRIVNAVKDKKQKRSNKNNKSKQKKKIYIYKIVVAKLGFKPRGTTCMESENHSH